MKNGTSVVKLVERAQRGETDGVNRLVAAVKVRLYEYTVRMTLDEALAEDVVQESLLIMVQDIGTLRDAGQLWPWLMKIATNKVRSYHRRNGRRSRLLSESGEPSPTPSGVQDAVTEVISKEIRQIVLSAMHRLPLEDRLILNMRCYEEMSFPEIAEALSCRKFKARALFAKAKRRLGRNLAKSGLGKGSLLGALVIFGKISARSEASGLAASVSTASLKVGLLPTLAAVAATRAALVTVAAVGVTAAGASLVVDGPGGEGVWAAGSAVSTVERLAGQQEWYYYPPRSKGAVLIQIRTSEEGRRSEWRWFQNEDGNYSCSGDTVYRRNAHYYAADLATMRLPTDSAALRSFLEKVESIARPQKRVRGTEKGLLVVAGVDEEGPFSHVREGYDITDEQAFRHPWQHDVKITDYRDAVHREGWAYLRISGQIGGRAVSGTGRIPLVLGKRRAMFPWLRLVVEDSVILEDRPSGAVVCDGSGRIRHRFAGGAFLEGLSRPWEGLHTIDTVRRDAGRRSLWFETLNVVEDQHADVAVTQGDVRLVYRIDLERDVVEEITLYERQSEVGRLGFEYVGELETEPDGMNEPGSAGGRSPRRRRSDTLWLFSLVQATWD